MPVPVTQDTLPYDRRLLHKTSSRHCRGESKGTHIRFKQESLQISAFSEASRNCTVWPTQWKDLPSPLKPDRSKVLYESRHHLAHNPFARSCTRGGQKLFLTDRSIIEYSRFLN